MTAFLSVVNLLTKALIALPTVEKIVRAILDEINKAVLAYDQAKFEKELKEAAKKLEETNDTSDLEHLMGRKP
jgi:hypothetical protein